MEGDWKPMKPLINSAFRPGNPLQQINNEMMSKLIQLWSGILNLEKDWKKM